MLKKFKSELQKLADQKKADISKRFFKTGVGQYGEGDIFLGISIPEQRDLAKKYYQDLTLLDLQNLLNSKIHEERLSSLLVLILKNQIADELEQKAIFDFYLQNTKKINNWDLVDLSASKILGKFLSKKSQSDKAIIYQLAHSKNLWERRIAMLACFWFIKHKDFDDALKISELLVNDGEDLIQKAVGWMLREIGKRDQDMEENFLKKYYQKMPRTMLRYAIEKFDTDKKAFYMKK